MSSPTGDPAYFGSSMDKTPSIIRNYIMDEATVHRLGDSFGYPFNTFISVTGEVIIT